jgi:hypothetical protein
VCRLIIETASSRLHVRRTKSWSRHLINRRVLKLLFFVVITRKFFPSFDRNCYIQLQGSREKIQSEEQRIKDTGRIKVPLERQILRDETSVNVNETTRHHIRQHAIVMSIDI